MDESETLSAPLVRTVLDTAPDAMVLMERNGSVVYANQQALALFGYEKSEIVGRPVDLLLPARFRDVHAAHRQEFAQAGRRPPMGSGQELFALRKDGLEFPVEISLSPVTDGSNVLVTATIRDVTDRRCIQWDLEEARSSADRANLAKSRFLATASHDLRQPLQTLSLLSGSLHRIVTDPDIRAVVQQQDQAIGAMSRLLNALLDISKLESGVIKPEISDFTVAALFEELRNEFAGLAAEKGLRLAVEPSDDAVHSDPSLLGQVLRNLVSNAIKYTRDGLVQLRCLHDEAFVRIEVLDTGIGIPADQLACIYDEFYQVGASTNRARDGYGLGLSIVQRIVRLLDLKLDVTSEIGKGSAFTLKVPASHGWLSRTPVLPTGRRVATGPSKRLPHVLLVEDDAAVRDATRMLLKVAGYWVMEATCVAEAAECARQHPNFDLLITDYHLGGTETGMDAISAVRAVCGSDLKAVLVTGDTSSRVRELKSDPNMRCTSKPIDADEFLSLLAVLQS